jgi:hypothetical protein
MRALYGVITLVSTTSVSEYVRRVKHLSNTCLILILFSGGLTKSLYIIDETISVLKAKERSMEEYKRVIRKVQKVGKSHSSLSTQGQVKSLITSVLDCAVRIPLTLVGMDRSDY